MVAKSGRARYAVRYVPLSWLFEPPLKDELTVAIPRMTNGVYRFVREFRERDCEGDLVTRLAVGPTPEVKLPDGGVRIEEQLKGPKDR